MISLKDIISERQSSKYSALVLIKHTDDTFITNILDEIRAIDRVVVVSNETPNPFHDNQGVARIKILTTKPPQEAFSLVKQDALKNIPGLKDFKYNPEKITKVD